MKSDKKIPEMRMWKDNFRTGKFRKRAAPKRNNLNMTTLKNKRCKRTILKIQIKQ